MNAAAVLVSLLVDEVDAVEHALADASARAGDLTEARRAVARLVSRDVSAADETQIRTAAIASLAESVSDAFIASLCWFAAFGLPGAATYRFLNTADAMWGYRDERWRHAGRIAARADDVATLLPARLTGLVLARQGVRVAPFKAQNMSNNARVVCGGGEIGVAQWLQTRAAGVEPDVPMNPVLLKPEAGTSQVIRLGQVDHELSARPWRGRSQSYWPTARNALDELLADFDVVVIEGAGSPAEINLADDDVVNMRTAAHADAPVLLVADIDRGGAFAHLSGTWALVPERDRHRIAGFVLDRFRGDASLLPPGPQQLETLTGVPTIGVVPLIEHDLPDEDGAASHGVPRHGGLPTVAVLPDSKHVVGDLAWPRRTGLAATVTAAAAAGSRVVGICGGMQLLGQRLHAPAGIDGGGDGLGLPPLTTTFARDKHTAATTARFADDLPPLWRSLAGRTAAGYEIRHGSTQLTGTAGVALPGARLGRRAGARHLPPRAARGPRAARRAARRPT